MALFLVLCVHVFVCVCMSVCLSVCSYNKIVNWTYGFRYDIVSFVLAAKLKRNTCLCIFYHGTFVV